VSSDDLHENLTADFPRAVSAKCDGHGWAEIVYASEDAGTASPLSARCPRCQRAKARRAIEAFIPPRFCEPVEIPEAVAAWARNGDRAQGLYLAGQVGTGKTHTAWMATAAWCLAADVVPRDGYYAESYEGGGWRGPTVVFARMTDLLDDFRPGDDSVRRVRDCQRAALLVIDDLGAEKPSEWTQERLYSVVDHRYANCMPLLVTGNLPPAKLAEEHTGDRVASRLAEMCRGRVVPMTGTDRRRAA
jgi:DNA replication protein DnaC